MGRWGISPSGPFVAFGGLRYFPAYARNRNLKHPDFEEVYIPRKIDRSHIPPTGLPGLLFPAHRMVNAIP